MKLFINENASENIVGEMVAILSKGRWFKFSFLKAKWSPYAATVCRNMPQSKGSIAMGLLPDT